jgi:Protein of unknown function (DUF5132)
MKDLGERLEGLGWLGLGIGALVAAPMLIPALNRGLRPLAKGAIKGYLALQERTRELVAESNEQFQDLVAEAKAEFEARDNGAGMMTLETAEAGAKGGEGSTEESKPKRTTRARAARSKKEQA